MIHLSCLPAAVINPRLVGSCKRNRCVLSRSLCVTDSSPQVQLLSRDAPLSGRNNNTTFFFFFAMKLYFNLKSLPKLLPKLPQHYVSFWENIKNWYFWWPLQIQQPVTDRDILIVGTDLSVDQLTNFRVAPKAWFLQITGQISRNSGSSCCELWATGNFLSDKFLL